MGLFSKFKKGLSKGSSLLQGAMIRVSGRKTLSEEDLFDLEEAFYSCDFGPDTTEAILAEIHSFYRSNKDFRGEDIRLIARSVLTEVLRGSEGRLDEVSNGKPEVICLIGVNGSGKTTTSAKLGHRLTQDCKSVLLGACDTFRAAATEQLKEWAHRLNLDLVSGHHGADSAAVAFDAYTSALSKGCDYLLLDTAGRLHVKDHLMDELSKLKRVLQKRDDASPHHSWLVIDGSTGTNGVAQAKVFHQKFGLTGLVITKLDGTAKGGALVSIYRELKLPVYFLGLGEQPDDLQPFSIDAYLDSLLPDLADSTAVLPAKQT
jgi:fused signal recognition particle receptor